MFYDPHIYFCIIHLSNEYFVDNENTGRYFELKSVLFEIPAEKEATRSIVTVGESTKLSELQCIDVNISCDTNVQTNYERMIWTEFDKITQMAETVQC